MWVRKSGVTETCKIAIPMFDLVQKSTPHHLRNFVLHSLIACFIVPLAGLGIYWITPFAGAVIGVFATRKLRDRAAIFVVVPTTLLFVMGVVDPIFKWDASWSHMTHWQYFKNTMFGPDCGAQECLYTLLPPLFTGGIGYAIGAYLVLWGNIFSK